VIAEMEEKENGYNYIIGSKKKGKGCKGVRDYIHCYSGLDKRERAKDGISIMINKTLQKYVTTWETISEHMTKLRLQIRGQTITTMGVYAPNKGTVANIKDKFEVT
jgi:hypothetical protein